MTAPGTPGAVTSALPTVTVSVVDGLHTVLLSLADQPDVLRALARCFVADGHLWTILADDRLSNLHGPAFYGLTHDRDVRDALTLTLGPDKAEDLATLLDVAALAPNLCDVCDQVATRKDGLCGAHGDAEDNRARVRMLSAGLKFYPSSHRYKIDGQWVPGVTTILGCLAKPALVKWSAGAVAEYVADHRDAVEHLYGMGRAPMVSALKAMPWQQSQNAADRGTTFHDLAERIIKGETVEPSPEQAPLVDSAMSFLRDYRIRPVLAEVSVGSREHRYAGRLDLVADSTIGRAVWDWKSGKRIYPEASLQLNAYGHAEFHGEDGDEHSMADLRIEAAYGVHIRADGYDVYPLVYGPEAFAEFLTIRKTYDIKKRADGDWKVPGSGYVGVALDQQESVA